MLLNAGQNSVLSSSSISVSLKTTEPSKNWGILCFIKDQKGGSSVLHAGNPVVKGAVLDVNMNTLDFNTLELDNSVSKITIAISTRGDNKSPSPLIGIPSVLVKGDSDYQVSIESETRKEKALLVLDIYRHKDLWKIKALRGGFLEGFSALLKAMNSGFVDVNEALPSKSTKANKKLIKLKSK